ncbi:MAG: 3'-5' exonuclease [Aeromonas jandaei]
MASKIKSHFILDVETLGLKRDAKLLSIGCAQVDLETGLILSEFYVEIDQSFYKHALFIDKFSECQSTVEWWRKSNTAEFLRLLNENNKHKRNAHQAIRELFAYMEINSYGDIVLWGNSPTFDNEKIYHHAEAYGVDIPNIPYWNNMDYRTVRTLFEARFGSLSKYDYLDGYKHNAHNALSDSIQEAKALSYMLKKLEIKM